jgi:asparagine synthase (glutamine-hydrolysing)
VTTLSGIAGIYDFDGAPVDRSLLERMTEAASHRGPDGSSYWISGSVGLGHRLLRNASGPCMAAGVIADDDGHVRLTFDGRIDNRDELEALLRADGASAVAVSDAELVLRSYDRWGPACVEMLLGDFAFALWDARRRRLFCARDPIGVKPLHYHFDGRRLLVASEPAQILESVSARPNVGLIARYLADDYTEREETLYTGILRLEPAHTLVAGPEGYQIECYWDVDPGHEIRYASDGEYDEHFSSLFRRAVAARLEAPGPVGALLSGGLDSSSIVCTASDLYRTGEASDRGFETYSMLFDTLPCDEREYIEAVTRRTGFPSNIFHYEREDAVSDLDACRACADVRYAPITVALMSALRDARGKGVRVLLSGTGGDEFLASGFHHLTDLMLAGRFWTLARQLRSDVDLFATSAPSLFGEYCLKPLIPRRFRGPMRRLVHRVRGESAPDWLAPGVLEDGRADGPARERDTAFPTRTQRYLHEVLLFNSNLTYAVGENDALASRFGMEYRYPFLDKQVVEFLFAIPEEQRWWMDRPKAIVRRSLRDVLPEAIRERRSKAEFSVVLDHEIRGRIASKVEGLIRESALAEMGVVDSGRLLHRFNEFVGGRDDPGSRWALYNFIGLELWSRSLSVGSERGGAA